MKVVLDYLQPLAVYDCYKDSIVSICSKFLNVSDFLLDNIIYIASYDEFYEDWYKSFPDYYGSDIAEFNRWLDDCYIISKEHPDHHLVEVIDNIYFCHEPFGGDYIIIKK